MAKQAKPAAEPAQPAKVDAEAAGRAVVNRLWQLRRLWEDAAEAYFDPARFYLALQTCITTARTVTFIIQSNKAAVPDFDTWYGAHQERMGADPIMVWARDTRNSIEKQGDLEGHSQVRVEIIASYMDGPKTEWMPAQSMTTQQIHRDVPRKFLVPQAIEHGTLLIERRWVANTLPDTEILEALGHVYGALAGVVADFLKTLKLSVPEFVTDSTPDSMARRALDRAIYVSVKDGSLVGVRREYAKKPPAREKILIKRYGKKGAKSWEKVREAKTFQEACEAHFHSARIILRADGYHRAIALFLKGPTVFRVIGAEHPDRASRYILMRELAAFAEAEGADGFIFINEAWTAHVDDVGPSGYAVDSPKRGEALMLSGVNSKGEQIAVMAAFHRKKNKTHKVKSIEPSKVTVGEPGFILIPFLKVWGVYDPKVFKKVEEDMDKAGLAFPMVAEEDAPVATGQRQERGE